MKPREDLKIYTLRHFLFYMGLASVAGALIGTLAGVMDWSNGLIYGVGLPTSATIAIFALREGLFGPTQRSGGPRSHSHA